jgi:osmotically-inducible protein OsmY
MKNISIATGLALLLAVAPAEAKHANKIKTVVGCVEGSQHHYQLSTTTKKGKHKVYDLGDRDFHDQVGHKVEARGAVSGENFKVTTMKSLGSDCR